MITGIPGYYEIALGLISVMVAIGGMVLGLGYAMDNKKLKEWGLNELLQSGVNGAIVVSLLFAFSPGGALLSIINGLAPNSVSYHSCGGVVTDNIAIGYACSYLDTVIISPATNLLTQVAQLQFIMSTLASFKFGVDVIVQVDMSLQALNVYANGLSTMMEFLSAAIVAGTLEKIILQVIAVAAVSLVLPLGLLLRTFTPTRETVSLR